MTDGDPGGLTHGDIIGLNNNCDLPKHFYALLRAEFCNNLELGTEGLIPCVVFGVEAQPGRALGFHVLREDGAMVSQVPIHALCHLLDAPQMELSECCPWDSFGYWLTAIEFQYLREVDITYRTTNGSEHAGTYICTIDFLNNGFSDEPEQHKHFHLLALQNGNYALQPNNRCRVKESSFTENLFAWDAPPRIQTNRLRWYAE
ncbi:MAG: hypothetical protein L0Y58_22390 [Verrucomicrobia subdivision 3 bacterium]|nr:hypothetical protein [Limisphaerales bacterium]